MSDALALENRRAIVSVFSGAGGLDLGFREAGFESVFASDNFPAAVLSFNKNFGEGICVNLNLLRAPTNDVLAQIEERVTKLQVVPCGLIGGPPCQGVSAANNSSSLVDPRNRLFARYGSLVLALEEVYGLDFFVFENVLGLKQKKSRALYERLVARLSTKFELFEQIIDSSKFGVPQCRRRLIIVGINRKKKLVEPFRFPEPVEGEPLTVGDAIRGFPEPEYFVRGGGSSPSAFHANHWTMARKSAKFHGSEAFETPPNSRSFIRLDWNKPSRTVAYGNREIHLHPDGRRRLSIFDAMLLQGFPRSFELCGNFSDQVTQVSNAVPPPIAKVVGEQIRKAIYG